MTLHAAGDIAARISSGWTHAAVNGNGHVKACAAGWPAYVSNAEHCVGLILCTEHSVAACLGWRLYTIEGCGERVTVSHACITLHLFMLKAPTCLKKQFYLKMI